jgi:hypothetical protein
MWADNAFFKQRQAGKNISGSAKLLPKGIFYYNPLLNFYASVYRAG